MCIQFIMKNVVFLMAAIVMVLASTSDEATMAWKKMAEPGPIVSPQLRGRIEPVQWEDLGAGCCSDRYNHDLFRGYVDNLDACKKKCLEYGTRCKFVEYGWEDSTFCYVVSSDAACENLNKGPNDCGSTGNDGVHSYEYTESVDCVWGEYGDWSTCSATCDGGTRTRTRTEATLAAYGGAACNGLATETEACKTEACPACTFEKFDGPVVDKGGKVGSEMGIDLEGCKELCNGNNACQSFVYQPKKEGCYLKDKKLIGTEPLVRDNPNFFSVRKIC